MKLNHIFALVHLFFLLFQATACIYAIYQGRDFLALWCALFIMWSAFHFDRHLTLADKEQ